MSRQTAYCVGANSDAVFITEEPDHIGTVKKLSAKRAIGLETYYHKVAFRPPDVILQVMQNAAAAAHAATRDDDRS
jgi:hypothetical protein